MLHDFCESKQSLLLACLSAETCHLINDFIYDRRRRQQQHNLRFCHQQEEKILFSALHGAPVKGFCALAEGEFDRGIPRWAESGKKASSLVVDASNEDALECAASWTRDDNFSALSQLLALQNSSSTRVLFFFYFFHRRNSFNPPERSIDQWISRRQHNPGSGKTNDDGQNKGGEMWQHTYDSLRPILLSCRRRRPPTSLPLPTLLCTGSCVVSVAVVALAVVPFAGRKVWVVSDLTMPWEEREERKGHSVPRKRLKTSRWCRWLLHYLLKQSRGEVSQSPPIILSNEMRPCQFGGKWQQRRILPF